MNGPETPPPEPPSTEQVQKAARALAEKYFPAKDVRASMVLLIGTATLYILEDGDEATTETILLRLLQMDEATQSVSADQGLDPTVAFRSLIRNICKFDGS